MNHNFLSAVIITFNEENIITKCINSLDFVNEIIILDSFSTDKTIEIASKYNTKIYQYNFDNYASQRNRALNLVSKHSNWILMIDADEIISPNLKYEILSITNDYNNSISLYNVRRKDIYNNKWMKYSSGYPTWFGRLFKKDKVWVERDINEEYHTLGKVGFLNEHLLHYPYNKGFSCWVQKHNKYSSMEAELHSHLRVNFTIIGLFTNDPVKRRKNLKLLFYRLPFRPFLMFFILYFIRLGFLDGKLGLRVCIMRSFYEWMINVKIDDLNQDNN
jgi:glycosyltransferase involved in cell wall biosynthesis